MALKGFNIVVIGAGIGGLVSALALRAHGASVTVLEQADSITELGAGLQISPNGVVVLRALGLEPRLACDAVRGRAVVLREHCQGREVLRLDLTQLAPEQHYFFVHRADLIDQLAQAARAAGVHIRLSQRVVQVIAGPRPVVVLDEGTRIEAELVVGADGLHSVARATLNGPDRPFFTGQVAWRAVVPNLTNLAAEANVFMGPGQHLVAYPLRGGDLVNLVAVQARREWTREGWHHHDTPCNLRDAFSGFGGVAADLLEQVQEVGIWGLFRHPVAPRWHQGGVALLGDAAHPTLPFMAQGANMALEDAWVLADCLRQTSDIMRALSAYQARRRERAERVVAAANGNAWKYHLRAPLRGPAHLALRLGGRLMPGRMVHQFDWLYGHDVTAS
ncbi:FAD-dependent monooxygenase [Pontibaca salina]|uniref:FAD-dependent monooxygenase n=1 Tax=Pontibaca salina TaxID=2795731 RepID=A0A934HQG2_9RHOB|nr:FAD-dependent monooxygenase [Pontibaca salina]MBI6629822.1 FAD-dependent monooxygenase [Pontibaca salina]